MRLGHNVGQLQSNHFLNGEQDIRDQGRSLVADTWYCLEFYMGNDPDELQVFLDGQDTALSTTNYTAGAGAQGNTNPIADFIPPLEAFRIGWELQNGTVFFDDVAVPADRMLGALNGGWDVAMSILPFERSSCFWQRIAYLYNRLERLVDVVPGDDDHSAAAIGTAYLDLFAVRARSRATQHRLAAGATLGADTSIDKVLLAGAEQQLYDTVRDLLPGVIELDETDWRTEYLYSRAATIYGGTAEVQRNIIARRLLDLGKE